MSQAFKRIKERESTRVLNKSVLSKYRAAGVIHRENHMISIPRGKFGIAVKFLDPMLPYFIEGILEEKLYNLQNGIKPII